MKQMKGESHEPMGLNIEDERQQRAGLFLRDVKYRIHADLHFDQSKDTQSDYGKYAAMFERRAGKGQCFNQPYLGCREFSCAFRLIDKSRLDSEAPAIADRQIHHAAEPVEVFHPAGARHAVQACPALGAV